MQRCAVSVGSPPTLPYSCPHAHKGAHKGAHNELLQDLSVSGALAFHVGLGGYIGLTGLSTQ
jgi:hypothetical protein